ncbi:hypothetical protein [Caviibacter abscessus]|nr:hypothetical protein [Caviibacter abscessus]
MEEVKSLFPLIVIVAFIVSMKFAMDGIMHVLINHKEKLGIYSLAGCKNIYLAYIITVDLVKSVFLASIFGAVLGIVYSYFIISLLELIFGISNISVNIIGIKIMLEYCFLIVSVIQTNYFIACLILNKKDIKDLMYHENILKVEDAIIKRTNIQQYSIITLCILYLTVFFILLSIKNITYSVSIYYIMISLVLISCVIYRITKIILIVKLNRNLKFLPRKLFEYVFSNEVKRNWKNYYTNQCISITILSLACVLLFVSLTIGYSYKENIAKEAPFDLAISVDAKNVSFADVKKNIDAENISDEIEYKIYLNEDMEKSNLPKQFIKLSDYNYLRKLLKKEPINLEKKQYLIQVEDVSVENKIKKEVHDTQRIIKNEKYFMNKEIQNFPFLQSNINGQFELLVFNDEEIDRMNLPVIRNVFIVEFNNKPAPQLKRKLFEVLNSSSNLVIDRDKDHITIKVVLKEWTRLNGLVALSIFTIFGIFLGSILMLIAISNIAFFSIKNLEKIDRENKIYFNLGWNSEEINRYNTYRIKKYYENSIYMTLLSLVIATISLYLLVKDYLDKDMYILVFSIVSFCLYLFIMIGYRISLLRILYDRK